VYLLLIQFNTVIYSVITIISTMWFVDFSWQNMIIGFILFRIFDIIKPWPIKWVDKEVDKEVSHME